MRCEPSISDEIDDGPKRTLTSSELLVDIADHSQIPAPSTINKRSRNIFRCSHEVSGLNVQA